MKGKNRCKSANSEIADWKFRPSASVVLSQDELYEINEATAKVKTQGARLPEAALKMTGL